MHGQAMTDTAWTSRSLGRFLGAGVAAWMLAAPVAVAQPGPVAMRSFLDAPAFFAVSVADLDAGTAWYDRVLGTGVIRDVVSRDGRGRARILRAGLLVVELLQYEASVPIADLLEPDAHPLRAQGLFKAGLFVSDAAGLHNALRLRGVVVDAQVLFDATMRSYTFVFRDGDGNRIQVFQPCEDCAR